MPDLPAGTVTFLFTDIEGSTRLWEEYPQAMQAALACHDTLLRAAIAGQGGHVFKTVGDAFHAVFARASDALAAALAAQRALAAQPWDGDTGPLRVRMALHTGLAEARDGDYFGPPLNRLARLLAAGYGGQILLTAVTESLAGEAIPVGAELRDLGEHRLKDLPRPERVFQLVAPGLPADFPPLRVPDSFDAHFDAVTKDLDDGRVILFLGSGVNLCGRPATKKWQAGVFDCLPSDGELAEHLARSFDYPANEPQDLVRVSQYVAVRSGVGPLYDELHALFDADYPPTPLHRFAAALPAALRERGCARPYQLVVTTNYDDALERAFREAGEPYDLVAYVAEGEERGKFVHWTPDGDTRLIERPNEYRGLSPEQRTVILKIHGVVDRVRAEADSFVITEDHYIDYLTRTDISNLLPVTLAAKLRRSHYLFLGYRLRDWNLRVILHRIWGQQRLAYKSWAVQPDSRPIDQEFWHKREVDILNLSLEDYVAALRRAVLAPPAQTGTAGSGGAAVTPLSTV